MADPVPAGALYLLARRWGRRASETAYVERAVAGAASRHRPVAVLTPGPPGPARGDGAFDVHPVGSGSRPEAWPGPDAARWPAGPPATTVLVEPGDRAAVALARAAAPDAAVVELVGPFGMGDPEGLRADAALAVTPGAGRRARDHGVGDRSVFETAMHVPVNRLAADHRHNGIGFDDYLLVLSDRAGAETTPWAPWLAARFPRDHVVVVENATARVYLGRALRGLISVDTRTDLWRFMAFARATVDLRPGTLVARECVESLRLATPIVVPAGSVGAEHALAGGGLVFDTPASLFDQIASLSDPARRAALAEAGQAMAEVRYGDAPAFSAAVANALSQMDELSHDRGR